MNKNFLPRTLTNFYFEAFRQPTVHRAQRYKDHKEGIFWALSLSKRPESRSLST